MGNKDRNTYLGKLQHHTEPEGSYIIDRAKQAFINEHREHAADGFRTTSPSFRFAEHDGDLADTFARTRCRNPHRLFHVVKCPKEATPELGKVVSEFRPPPTPKDISDRSAR